MTYTSRCITMYLVILSIYALDFEGGMKRGMQEKYERQMKKGVLDMLVMRLLLEEKKYGYQLIAELKDRGGPLFGLKEGTLYPILYRLEDEGLIESRWVEGENRQTPRKYYLMTDKGRTALNEIYQVWRQITDGVERPMGQEE